MATVFTKDPDAELDFVFDWSSWLESGETISSCTVLAQTGLTASTASESAGKVTTWLSGGTAGTTYTVACKVTTNASRTDERTIRVMVVNR